MQKSHDHRLRLYLAVAVRTAAFAAGQCRGDPAGLVRRRRGTGKGDLDSLDLQNSSCGPQARLSYDVYQGRAVALGLLDGTRVVRRYVQG